MKQRYMERTIIDQALISKDIAQIIILKTLKTIYLYAYNYIMQYKRIFLDCLEFYMFSWCSRTGTTFVKLPAPDGLVRMFLQVMSGGSTWGESGPHHPTVLHGVGRAGIKHRFILQPTVLCLHAGSCVGHGHHSALAVSIAIYVYIINYCSRLWFFSDCNIDVRSLDESAKIVFSIIIMKLKQRKCMYIQT